MCLNYIQIKEIHNNHFTKCSQICEYIPALAKSKVSRGKLNYLLANDSTPFNRAFFVRNIRTPQEFADFVLFNLKIHSMVERSGQPLAVGCFPVKAVFHPVTFYRPTVESLAVVSKNLLLETTQMYQFIFAAIRRTDLTNHCSRPRILGNITAKNGNLEKSVISHFKRILTANFEKIKRPLN